MIEFKGYLTGAAEKGYRKKVRQQFWGMCCFAIPVGLPFMYYIGRFLQEITGHDEWVRYVFCVLLLLLPLFGFIPLGKKDYMSMSPKRIIIRDDHMISMSEKDSVSRYVREVSKVIDHEEFYEICFPWRKFSERFICQKSLLKKGSLRMLEELFEGKMIKK